MLSPRLNSAFIVLFLVFTLSFPTFTSANDAIVGSIAPPFKVMSGEKEALTLDNIKGKVAVLFYEAKNAIERNRKLKINLNIFYAAQPATIKKDIVRIGIINCRGVLFRGIWEKEFRDNSIKERTMIYGDWDGEMSAAYHAAENESNIIIIDRKGVIRYFASGPVGDEDIGEIKKLLGSLVRER